jgi:hypothetical protein
MSAINKRKQTNMRSVEPIDARSCGYGVLWTVVFLLLCAAIAPFFKDDTPHDVFVLDASWTCYVAVEKCTSFDVSNTCRKWVFDGYRTSKATCFAVFDAKGCTRTPSWPFVPELEKGSPKYRELERFTIYSAMVMSTKGHYMHYLGRNSTIYERFKTGLETGLGVRGVQGNEHRAVVGIA